MSGTKDETHEIPKVEILNGQLYRLKWSKPENRWCAVHLDSGLSLNSRAKTKWTLIVFSPPYRVGSDNKLVLSSACAKAYSDSKSFHTLLQNVYQRDEFNTAANVFTNMQRDIRSVNGNKPWFTPADSHATMQGVPGVTNLDFDTLVSDRLETISRLGTLSQQARRDTFNMYRPLGKVGGAQTQPPEREPQEHQEHFITDGFDYSEVSYRRGPEHGVDVLDRLLNQVLFSWQVPPQVLGKNINSERLASSNRLSEMAIGRYDSHVKQLRIYIGNVLREISSVVSGDTTLRTWITIEPCVTSHTLKTVQQFLKPEKLRELFACVYDLPESAFSKEAFIAHQQMVLNGGKPPDQIQTRNKPAMEQDAKDANMQKKAQDPDKYNDK